MIPYNAYELVRIRRTEYYQKAMRCYTLSKIFISLTVFVFLANNLMNLLNAGLDLAQIAGVVTALGFVSGIFYYAHNKYLEKMAAVTAF